MTLHRFRTRGLLAALKGAAATLLALGLASAQLSAPQTTPQQPLTQATLGSAELSSDSPFGTPPDTNGANSVNLREQAQQALDAGRIPASTVVHSAFNRLLLERYGTGQRPGSKNRNTFATPTLQPGSHIIIGDPHRTSLSCTAGFFGSNTEDGSMYLVTAGHCFNNVPTDVALYYVSNSGLVRVPGQLLVRDAPPNDFDPDRPDWAVFHLTDTQWNRTHVSPRLDGSISPRGAVMLHDLAAGQQVCMVGYRSGQLCGAIIATGKHIFEFEGNAIGGDSGGLVYVKTGPDTLSLVGVIHGHPVSRNNSIPQVVQAVRFDPPIQRLTQMGHHTTWSW
ncbi:hypothetical protein [Corynebacterium aquilae]|uniref:hypothetical protein n=1 Tax=Corynebacterium aquilae TaxID=203263 RepID=UPI000952B61D|nr:hypothetical protein [Corynebacterium aquilae]